MPLQALDDVRMGSEHYVRTGFRERGGDATEPVIRLPRPFRSPVEKHHVQHIFPESRPEPIQAGIVEPEYPRAFFARGRLSAVPAASLPWKPRRTEDRDRVSLYFDLEGA